MLFRRVGWAHSPSDFLYSYYTFLDDYLKSHPEYIRFYRNVNCPDENFFQTLVINSPYKDKREDYLHYVDWSEGGNSPKTLTIDDYEKISGSDKLMARKFDIEQRVPVNVPKDWALKIVDEMEYNMIKDLEKI